jgi:DNA-binding IscR family transcriptional regulator
MPSTFAFIDKDGKRITLGEIYKCAANSLRALHGEPPVSDENEKSHDCSVYDATENIAIHHGGETIEQVKQQYTDNETVFTILSALEKELNVQRFESSRYA